MFGTRYPKIAGVIFIGLAIALGAAFLAWVRDASNFLWLCIFGGLFVAFVAAAILPIPKLPTQR